MEKFILFHGTSQARAAAIKAEGFVWRPPTELGKESFGRGCYFFPDSAEATAWAEDRYAAAPAVVTAEISVDPSMVKRLNAFERDEWQAAGINRRAEKYDWAVVVAPRQDGGILVVRPRAAHLVKVLMTENIARLPESRHSSPARVNGEGTRTPTFSSLLRGAAKGIHSAFRG